MKTTTQALVRGRKAFRRFIHRNISTGPPDRRFNLTDQIEVGLVAASEVPQTAAQSDEKVVLWQSLTRNRDRESYATVSALDLFNLLGKLRLVGHRPTLSFDHLVGKNLVNGLDFRIGSCVTSNAGPHGAA